MAQFLRDVRISNLTLDINSLQKICNLFTDRLNALSSDPPQDNQTYTKGFLSYIIRFDNKGYRIFSVDELKSYYGQAKNVERIICSIESSESLKTNRNVGAYMELRLDKNEPSNCILTVTSDDKDWVEASYSATQELLSKFKNKNGLIRTAWTPFIVQILGVVIGFTLCLWVASKIAPNIRIENPFILVFLFVFLVFSNMWTYLNAQFLKFLGLLFPNIRFIREERERIHWLLRTLVGSSIFAVIIYLLSLFQSFLIEFFKNLLKIGA